MTAIDPVYAREMDSGFSRRHSPNLHITHVIQAESLSPERTGRKYPQVAQSANQGPSSSRSCHVPFNQIHQPVGTAPCRNTVLGLEQHRLSTKHGTVDENLVVRSELTIWMATFMFEVPGRPNLSINCGDSWIACPSVSNEQGPKRPTLQTLVSPAL